MALTKVSFSLTDGNMLNVKDFGAVGDGSADDTVAIQAAITSAASTYTDPTYGRGKKIFFPQGTYKITSTITIESFCMFIGEGARTSVINYVGSSGTALSASGALSTFSLKDIGISANEDGGTTHTSGWGIQIVGPARYTLFDNVTINGFANAVDIQSGWYIQMIHVQSFGSSNYSSGTPAAHASGTIGFKIGSSTVNNFTGNGSTDTFTFTGTTVGSVTIDGKEIRASGNWSVSGSDIVFTSAPASGAAIRVLTDLGGTTTFVGNQMYIGNYQTNIYNKEVTGFEAQNLILEHCDTGLKTEFWAFGSVYAENVYDRAFAAYMPIKFKCINNQSFWYKAGASGNIFLNDNTEQSSVIDEVNRPPAVVGYLASDRTITESIASSGLILWDKKYDGANLIASNGKISVPGRSGWYRLSGLLQISQMTSGDDVAAQIAIYNDAGSIILIERLRCVASGTEDYNYIKLEKIAYLDAGSSFGIFIGSNDNTLELQGAIVGGGNRECWVSVERLAY